jgi:hypothetical protein
MTPLKLNVMFSFFPYGGNGGCANEHPNIRSWFATTLTACNKDQRIGEIIARDYSDTPIPMMRNRAVVEARTAKADVLVMVDSDQHPDLYLGQEVSAEPFFESSFDFLYKRKCKGLVTTIGAPYCGPPPGECVYVFKWENYESANPNVDHRLEMYGRDEASIMSGIHPAAALPTGCIMFDMEMFNVTDPHHEYVALMKRYGDKRLAEAMTKPWFYYEYKDIYQSEKASTEDVTASRDMVLCAYAKLGYNTMFANWNAWAGHWKPKCVGKPVSLSSDSINSKYAAAVHSGRKDHHTMMDIGQLNFDKTVIAEKNGKAYNRAVINDNIVVPVEE